MKNYLSGIIDSHDIYNNLSGRKNLELYAGLNNMKDKDYINRLVELVKLSNRIDDKVKTYSLILNSCLVE